MAAPNSLNNIPGIGKEGKRLFLTKLYLINKMCSFEISEYILNKFGVNIAPRSIQRNINKLGISRNKSEAFTLCIQNGRKSYDHLRKKVKSGDIRKGINLKLRYQIMQRDNFKCVLCGATSENTVLMIDHINPVVKGGDNDEKNLRTLCRECNLGKMIAEHEK